MTQNEIYPGLAGVTLAETRLSHVDGLKGELLIAGYPLEEIAPRATFEEMTYLLWHGRRAQADELAAWQSELAQHRQLSAVALRVLEHAAAERLPAMDALRMAVGTLPVPADDADFAIAAASLLARVPVMVATYQRLLTGQPPLASRADSSLAANFLYQLDGAEPAAARVRALDTYLNTVVDHGLNASTFTARVIVSTQSDLVSALTGAIGALKGPLHGGAPGPALDMVFEIGKAERAEAYLRAKLDAGERLMGFGHRVYKVRDPRAAVLAQAAQGLFAADGDRSLYELASAVEKQAVTLLEEYKPGRNLQTNVEFYTALLLHGLGLTTDQFTPIFAMARTAGWLAHCHEQQEEGRLIRPRLSYQGPRHETFEALETVASSEPQ